MSDLEKEQFRQIGIGLINEYRQQRGLRPIDWLSIDTPEVSAFIRSIQLHEKTKKELATALGATAAACADHLKTIVQLREQIAILRHDLERQITIANEHVNEVERLREALRFYAREANYRSTTMYMSGQGGKTAVEIDTGSRAIAALQEQSK